MPRVEFLEAVRRAARNHWGQQFPSQAAAEKMLIDNPEKLAGYATLDLVRRFYEFCQAIAGGESGRGDSVGSRPTNAVKAEGLSVGDIIYGCDEMEAGVCRRIIVGFDSDGYPLACGLDIVEPTSWNGPSWIYDEADCAKTPAEALRNRAESDIAWHRPYLEWAEKCLRTIETCGDLSEFEAGHGEFDEEDAEKAEPTGPSVCGPNTPCCETAGRTTTRRYAERLVADRERQDGRIAKPLPGEATPAGEQNTAARK